MENTLTGFFPWDHTLHLPDMSLRFVNYEQDCLKGYHSASNWPYHPKVSESDVMEEHIIELL